MGYSQSMKKKTFENLVDYVNCRYVVTYIESRKDNPDEKENFDKYERYIKDNVNCNIDNPLAFEELSELLSENGWAKTDSNLVHIINQNKEKYDESLGVKELIALIVSTDKLSEAFQNKLNNEKLNLSKKIDKYITNETDPPSDPNAFNFFLILLICIYFLALLSLAIFVGYRTRRNKIIVTVLGSQRIKNEFAKQNQFEIINAGAQTDNKLSSQLFEVDRKLSRLESELEILKNQLKTSNEDIRSGPLAELPKDLKVKYLKTAPGGIFNNVFDSPNGCYFKLYEIEGSNAKFEFCGNIEEAIANRSAIFDETSEPFNPPENATQIITRTPGIATLVDGKWKVKDKAIIKFG